jgi:hypothetical protein
MDLPHNAVRYDAPRHTLAGPHRSIRVWCRPFSLWKLLGEAARRLSSLPRTCLGTGADRDAHRSDAGCTFAGPYAVIAALRLVKAGRVALARSRQPWSIEQGDLLLDYEDEDDRHTSVWILGAECGTSDGTILHHAFTCIVHITKVRSGRCQWPSACVLGDGSHASLVPLPPSGHAIHRGTRLPFQRR